MSITDEIAHAAAALVDQSLSEFRYFKSYHQARHVVGDVVEDIIFNVVRGSSGRYSLWLYFGVQHREIESLISRIKDQKLDNYSRTVFQNSVNIAPTRDMHFDGQTVWDGLRSPNEIDYIKPSLTHFLKEFVEPYHHRFNDISVVRQHLVKNDGWVLNHTPYEQVLAIDALAGEGDRAAEYLDRLQKERDGGYAWSPESFNSYYEALVNSFPGVLPEFVLR